MHNLVGVISVVLYFVLVIGICIYVLVLANRFVKAHQRGAAALETIANKIPAPEADASTVKL